MSKATATQRKRERKFIESVFDPKSSFTTEYYFEMLRAAGMNPRLERISPEQRVGLIRNVDRTTEEMALMFVVEQWASSTDPDWTQRNNYLDQIVIPDAPDLFQILLGEPRVALPIATFAS